MSTITLEIPEPLGYQLVYRQERDQPFELPLRPQAEFVMVFNAAQALRHLGVLRRHFGALGLGKVLAKLLSGRRAFYFMMEKGQLLTTGWCTVGRCRYYPIEPTGVVIGPIWSSLAARGQGLATRALHRAMNTLQQRGRRIFYIDAFMANQASHRVIAKSDFGAPVSAYLRH